MRAPACTTASIREKQHQPQHVLFSKKRSLLLVGRNRILLVVPFVIIVAVANLLPRVTCAATTHTFDDPDNGEEPDPPRRPGDRFRSRFRPRQRRRSNNDYQDNRRAPPPWWERLHNNNKNHQNTRFHHHRPPAFNAEAIQALQWLFPMRRPRHLLEGTRLAIRSFVTGLSLGLASLIVLPLRGWRQNMWPGLWGGTLAGFLYATIATMGGILHGTYQLIRGILSTPQALWAQQQGKVWHDTTEDWRYYYLQQELDELNATRNNTHHQHPVKDTTYYDLLQVPTHAPPADIKRAYYTLAREVHPDKNRGSSEQQAAAQFRQLHTAYTTLYNEERRVIYDQWGITANGSSNSDSTTAGPAIPEFDVKVFFSVLFSSELVDSYIGTLSIASVTEQLIHFQRSGSSPEELLQSLFVGQQQPTSHQYQTRRRRRQVEMAVTLQQRCAAFVQGNVTAAEFRQQARREAQQIAATPFGHEYLRVLGRAWMVEAQQYLGGNASNNNGGGGSIIIPGWGLIQSMGLALQRQVQNWRGRTRMVTEAVDLIWRLAKHEKDERGQIPEEDMELMVPEILDIAWAYNAHDIAHAVRGACFRLFHDRGSGHSRFAGLLRAEAMQILGEEFLAEGSVPEEDEPGYFMDFIARSEVAMQIAVMKASGQKDPVDAESMIKMHKRTPKQRTRQ